MDALTTSGRSTSRSLSRPSGFPEYDGDLPGFLSELAYWVHSQGASLQTVHMIENAAADVVELDWKLDEAMLHCEIEREKVEDLEAELVALKGEKEKDQA